MYGLRVVLLLAERKLIVGGLLGKLRTLLVGTGDAGVVRRVRPCCMGLRRRRNRTIQAIRLPALALRSEPHSAALCCARQPHAEGEVLRIAFSVEPLADRGLRSDGVVHQQFPPP